MQTSSDVDYSKLSKYKLNGTQIRNSISLAKSLSQDAGSVVEFEMLQKIVSIVSPDSSKGIISSFKLLE